jgi:hypothetical protein
MKSHQSPQNKKPDRLADGRWIFFFEITPLPLLLRVCDVILRKYAPVLRGARYVFDSFE